MQDIFNLTIIQELSDSFDAFWRYLKSFEVLPILKRKVGRIPKNAQLFNLSIYIKYLLSHKFRKYNHF